MAAVTSCENALYPLKTLITLKQVNTSVVEKKKNLYEQNVSQASMERLKGRVL